VPIWGSISSVSAMRFESFQEGSLEQAEPPGDQKWAARPNHTGRLILTTSDPHASPHADLLVELLLRLGFIGPTLEDRESAFRIGPGFLSLLSFNGCAVRIQDAPNADGAFCHVRVPPPSTHPQLHFGRNTGAPRCAGCRGRLADWRERTEHWRSHPYAGAACPTCGEIRPPWLWDWKQQGGFGRFFIQIEEVFPGEATPTQSLFEYLTRASGTGWRYFYVQD